MDKEKLFESLTTLEQAQAIVAKAREESRGILNELMKKQIKVCFPDNLVRENTEDELLDSLENKSESVMFYPDNGTGAPAVGLIESVEWKEEDAIAHVLGVAISAKRNGVYPRFDCSIDNVADVDSVIKFIMKFV